MSTLGLPRAATSREERRQKPMVVVGEAQQVVRVSKSFEQLVGVASRRYIVGRRLQELFADAACSLLWRSDGGKAHVHMTEVRLSSC